MWRQDDEQVKQVANVKKEKGLAPNGVIFGGVFLPLGACFNLFQQQTERSRGLRQGR